MREVVKERGREMVDRKVAKRCFRPHALTPSRNRQLSTQNTPTHPASTTSTHGNPCPRTNNTLIPTAS